MTAARRSLAARITWTTTLAMTAAAAATAVLAALLGRRMTLDREDARLRGAAAALLSEVDESRSETSVGEVLEEESAELGAADLRVALFDGSRRIGGRLDAPAPVRDGCESASVGEQPVRRCSVRSGRRTLLVQADMAGVEAAFRSLWWASLAAVLLSALGGAAASRLLARRISGPLSRLRGALGAVRGSAPAQAEPGTPEGDAEVDALRDALRELLARLDAALSQSRQFAGGAAHELRTPLAEMRAEAELALEASAEEGGDAPTAREALRRVAAGLERMSALVDRLLVLALPDEPQTWSSVAVSLADVAREAAAARGEAARARVTLDLDDEALVRGDVPLLRAMLDDALDNALTHSAGPVTVEVSVAGGSQVVLRIVDRGPGIAAADRERLFLPFQRAPARSGPAAPGHGLGLAMVRRVAGLHGGGAAFEDVPQGTSLRIALPCWTADPREVPEPQAGRAA